MRVALAIAAPLAVLAASTGQAQVWRSVRMERTIADTAPLEVRVTFGEGAFELRPGARPNGYAMTLKYDPARSLPRHTLDAAGRVLALGTTRAGSKFRLGGDDMGEANIELPNGVPLDVDVNIGAAVSTLDMGGLALQRLRLATGASQMRLRFNEPNRIPMESLSIDGSAALVRATGLANANANALEVQTHMGTVELDFGGEWRNEPTAELRVVLGSVVLRVPHDVGVEVQMSGWLSSFPAEGFARDGDVYRSANWGTATKRLRVRASSVLGRLSVVRSVG